MSAKRKPHPGGNWLLEADWNFGGYTGGDKVVLTSNQTSVIDEFHVGEWLQLSATGGRDGYTLQVGDRDHRIITIGVDFTKAGKARVEILKDDEQEQESVEDRLRAAVETLLKRAKETEAKRCVPGSLECPTRAWCQGLVHACHEFENALAAE